MHVSRIEPSQEVLLKQLKRARHSQLGSRVADTGVNRRKNRGNQPVGIVGGSIPIAYLLGSPPITDCEKVPSRQILIDQLRHVVGGQLNYRQDFGNRQRADGILCPWMIETGQLLGHLLCRIDIELELHKVIHVDLGSLLGPSFHQFPGFLIALRPMERSREIHRAKQHSLLLPVPGQQAAENHTAGQGPPDMERQTLGPQVIRSRYR